MKQVILISGAARGMGFVTANRLHQAGYRVFGAGRNPKPADAPFRLLPLDVGDEASVQACVAQVIDEAGQIDVLVNNAGYDLYGAAEETPWTEFLAQVDTNFFGALRLTQAVLPQMRKQGGGKIVTVSSIGVLLALPYNSAYAASKFALEGYSEALRYELLPANIFVSLIEPGQVRTDTLDSSIRSVPTPLAGRVAERARAQGRVANLTSEQVSDAIVRVLETPQPRLRYRVGRQVQAVVLLKQLLPQALFERFIMRQFVQPVTEA